ncbi:MAG TPA: class I SAM-dependent methyltransferase [Polyangiales bacterium]|nr:class I SAM-dependent methyltransferase [Polyangiales bacterium]
MSAVPSPQPNAPFIECWNDVLTPKWLRFRHLLSGNGAIHSDLAYPRMSIRRGQRVLDVACGFGETSIELADRVGPLGSVLGVDCTSAFIEIAEREREIAGVNNVEYWVADIDDVELPPHAFDVAVSRFGIMFCASPVRALRAIKRALVPGGELGLICWRGVADNPCWKLAEDVALYHLPPPGEQAQSCGPGPFSMGDRETDERILQAAGFEDVRIVQQDAELCVGNTLTEAIDYQMLVGPAGYVLREAGERGQLAAPAIRTELGRMLARHQRNDGSVWLPSSTWFLRARTPRD